MKTRIIKPRYDLWSYDGKNQSVDTISRDDVLAINRQSVDHFLSIDFGIWAFRTADGFWIEHKLSERSLGTKLLKIMDVVRCEPGEYFSPKDVAELTQIHHLSDPNNLSARWRAMRLAHEESFKKPHFFLSKRTGGMGIAWNPDRTFMQITRIRPDSESIHVPNVPDLVSQSNTERINHHAQMDRNSETISSTQERTPLQSLCHRYQEDRRGQGNGINP